MQQLSSPVLRREVAGILVDGRAGHGEWRAVDRECLLVGRSRARRYGLLYVHWTGPRSLTGYVGVGGWGLLTQWVRSRCAGGAARRDRR